MKSILKVLLKWKNWNNREVGNTYRFVSEDNFLYVQSAGTMGAGTITVRATIGGVEQEITRPALFGYHTDQITPGTVCTVTWSSEVLYVEVNNIVVYGSRPELQYSYQAKTQQLNFYKSTGAGHIAVVEYYDTLSQHISTQLEGNETALVAGNVQIGSIVHAAWSAEVTYIKINDTVIVG